VPDDAPAAKHTKANQVEWKPFLSNILEISSFSLSHLQQREMQ
jgi:hypothetical protein